MYVTFFTSKDGNMKEELFRSLCKKHDFDPELVECHAKILGYTFSKVLNLDLIDFIGFDYPYEIYEVMK